MTERSRVHSIDELSARIGGMISERGIAYANEFVPRADDIIIATYAKAGTTWMQQIVHGLRTGGDMNFSEITEVVPWIQLAGDLGLDLAADQRAHPRAFKSHETGDDIPKGCRYIYIVRDPIDSAVSFYNFMNGWFLEPGAVDLETFIATFYLKRATNRGYWTHLLSWWPARLNPDTLFLCYEDMQADLPGTVKTVADFMGIEDREAIHIATEQASFAFMKEHGKQFDDHLITEARNKACGLPGSAISTKVNTGKTGEGKQVLTPAARSMLDRAWEDVITPEIGFKSYAEFRAALADG